MTFRRRMGYGVVALAALLAACSPGAETADEPKGLPMWVIKDADSTIYLTGTVHALPPDLDWSSPRLEAALDEADELWLEVPMSGDQNAMVREMGPAMMRHMFSFDKPLSSLLTDEEEQALAVAIERAELPPEAAAGLENMKPWVAAIMIGMGPLIAAGYDPEAGVDLSLARMAEEQGDQIKGFETFAQQMEILAGGSIEEQLEGLRAVLAATPEEIEQQRIQSEAAFTAWARGEVEPVEDLVADMEAAGGMGGLSIEMILNNRNEDWAGQIEQLLAGEGVSFIAVGAAHLVGPNSVQERLKLRGIEAERF